MSFTSLNLIYYIQIPKKKKKKKKKNTPHPLPMHATKQCIQNKMNIQITDDDDDDDDDDDALKYMDNL